MKHIRWLLETCSPNEAPSQLQTSALCRTTWTNTNADATIDHCGIYIAIIAHPSRTHEAHNSYSRVGVACCYLVWFAGETIYFCLYTCRYMQGCTALSEIWREFQGYGHNRFPIKTSDATDKRRWNMNSKMSRQLQTNDGETWNL